MFRAALVATGVFAAAVLPAPSATASGPVCGVSGTHTVCVSTPGGVLTGPQMITVTNAPNKGYVVATWTPSGGSEITLITKRAPSASLGGASYSFVWPTQKYLDASGVLAVRATSSSTTPVTVNTIITNGNLTDIQHTPNDWQNFLPGTWTDASDPIVAAVGDGPADETIPNQVADSIVATDPALFLFLGDIYEKGTYAENLNHYGQLALGGDTGTLWGRLAPITQPSVGNHENSNLGAWTDFWHQRPKYMAFAFGGVLFLDLDSSTGMGAGSQQYQFVQRSLEGAPECVIAFWHIPATEGGSVSSKQLPMWKLLSDGGGDLVLNGHRHEMAEMVPLDSDGLSGGSAHMVELVEGSGGHQLGNGLSGPNVAWSPGKKAGALYVTLDGAAAGGTATSLTWAYKDIAGNVLRTGAADCGSGVPPPPPPPPATTTHTLDVSTSGDRSNPVTLDGADLSGNAYVFVSPESGASQVKFWLDDPTMSASPTRNEKAAPWDLRGSSSTSGPANPWDTTTVSNGQHSITILVTLSGGGSEVSTSTFTVTN